MEGLVELTKNTIRSGLEHVVRGQIRPIGATAATLVASIVIEMFTRRFADVSVVRLETGVLPLAAISARPLLSAIAVIAVAGFALAVRARLFMRWTDLEHGTRLRAAAGVLMVAVTWRLVTSPHNYLFDEWYAFDRLLLVLLVVAAVVRPVAILAVIVEIRLLQAPLRAPLFPHPGLNIDELAVLMIVALAAMVVLASVWKRYVTAAVLPVMVAAFGAQFFLPGRTKVRARWFDNDIANLPLSGYAQGWLGSGDGSFARSLSDIIDSVEPVVVLATLVFEVGVVIIVFHRRVFLGWLVAAVGFHVVVFASLGFVFFEFVVVEVVLASLVWGASGKDWSRYAFAVGPAIIGAFAIILGPSIFHPPTLAWFDSELSYSYVIDGFDRQETRYALVPADFAPYDDVVAFGSLSLGPTEPVAGAYGAASRVDDARIEGFESIDEVAAAEAHWDPSDSDAHVELLERFLLSTHDATFDPPQLLRPPLHFAISRIGAPYDGEVALERLVISRVTTLRSDDGDLVRREDVATIEIVGGEPVVRWA